MNNRSTHKTMDSERNPLKRATQFFIKITKLAYYFGLPYISIEKEPPSVTKISKVIKLYKIITNIVICVFVLMELGAHFTQPNLTEKQKSDRYIFSLAHPIFFSLIMSMFYYKNEITNLLHNLVVVLKETYNDPEVEVEMIRKTKIYTTAYLGISMSALGTYGVDVVIQMIRNGATFTTLITFWPDVEDRSTAASFARIIIYLVCWLFIVRLCGVYLLVIPTTICLSHQYKNLQSYFRSLNDIFDEQMSQVEKEQKFESSLKVGVKLHSHTRWCVGQCQTTFNLLFSSQVVLNILVLVLSMSKMVNSERTPVNVFAIIFMGFFVLSSTGLIMMNAGEVTVQAAEIPTAIYCSGWQNCYKSSTRIKHLVVSVMRQGQQPEILWALGVVPLSYESFVKILKSSYSVFSVLF